MQNFQKMLDFFKKLWYNIIKIKQEKQKHESGKQQDKCADNRAIMFKFLNYLVANFTP